MDGLGDESGIMIMLDRIKDRDEPVLENKRSYKFDCILFASPLSHLADDEGLFA